MFDPPGGQELCDGFFLTGLGMKNHPPLVKGCVQGRRGVSLVIRHRWGIVVSWEGLRRSSAIIGDVGDQPAETSRRLDVFAAV